MKIRTHIAFGLLAALLSLFVAAEPKPNVVIMMADDMGWGDWSRTGGHADTPHMEAMSQIKSLLKLPNIF